MKPMYVYFNDEGKIIGISNQQTPDNYTDPNEMDVLLRETISAGLAADIAYAITANLQVGKLMQEKYEYKLSLAKHTDASEGYNVDPANGQVDQILTEDFITSRY